MSSLQTKEETLDILKQVKGIGPKLAERIWQQYGERTIATLLNDTEAVAEAVRGVTEEKARAARDLLRQALNTPGSAGGISAVPVEGVSPDASPRAARVPQATADLRRLLPMEQVRKVLQDRWDEVHRRRREAEEVLHRHIEDIMRQPNVNGVHVGLRRRRGSQGESMIPEDLEVCIRVHVEKKLPEDDSRFGDPRLAALLPREIEGIPVDVYEQSYTTLDPFQETLPECGVAAEPLPRTPLALPPGYVDPIVGGIEIASASRPTNKGTLGGVVFSGVRTRFITNMHVVGGSGTVTQPAAVNPSQVTTLTIGEVDDAEMPPPGGRGSIDCAIIRPTSGERGRLAHIQGLQGPQRFSNGVLGPADVHITRAIKVGAITGQTSGVVKSVNAVVRIGNAIMPRQIVVEAEDGATIIRGGDSGSLLLTEMLAGDPPKVVGFNVVGLVHARSSDGSQIIATHFSEIAARFSVSVSSISV